MSFQLLPANPAFLNFPATPFAAINHGDVVIFGAGHGSPYPSRSEVSYETATASADAPQALRNAANLTSLDLDHWDFDLGGPLFHDGRFKGHDLGDLVLSRDSLLGQRIRLSFDVQSLDGVVDGAVEVFGVGEGLMGEVVGFQVSPDGFDVIEFRCVFGQPLDAQPMGARRERGLGGLAGMDRSVVEHDDDGPLALAGFGAVMMIEFFQKGDEVGAALGFGGGDDQPAVAPVERAHHRNLFGLTGCLYAQVYAAFGPGAGEIGMGQRLAFVGKQQHDVTGCGLRLA